MHIDTHTKDSMEASICDYFDIRVQDLNKLFDEIIHMDHTESIYIQDEEGKRINAFICSKMPRDRPIDQILFFHLSRRLNSAENCNTGNNLRDLLLTETPISTF